MVMLDKRLLDVERTDGPAALAWQVFDNWLAAWRHDHPDDDRSDLELIDEFARWCEETACDRTTGGRS